MRAGAIPLLRRAGLRKLAGLLPAIVIPAGCVIHLSHDRPPPPNFQYTPPTTAQAPFEYEARGDVALFEPSDRTRHHDIMHFSFESSGDNGNPQNLVEGQYFRSRSPGPKKLVVVMPIWGTSSYPPSKISYGYAQHSRGDAHVMWIYGSAPLFPWDDLARASTEAAFVAMSRDSAERYRATVTDMRRLIDWAETRPEIDASRVGFVGFSMSALVTATLVGNDSRVAAAVLMMGAANFADVFATCGDRAGEVREHVLRTFGWTLDEYREFFSELFGPADPVRYAGRYDPDRIFMIDAMFDDCMPESARAALWEITGHPQRVTMLYRHRRAFYSLTPLGLNYARRKIYRFLDDVL
jgi:hypothetical protein